ncbi:family 1 glycosylhydrolase [Mesoplasma chauliocola]|uniref:family 1 glycosylhydrolase n=1 Tax=Mesoplasma chauliocola TaxID=216427 RepID=UPI000A05E805|nr:family 1 glycosylhydrolase [Mesoplasma chauliocola]
MKKGCIINSLNEFFKSYRFCISWPRIIKNKIKPVVAIFHFDTPDFIQEVRVAWTNEFTNLFKIYSKILFKNFGSKVKYWLTINKLNMFDLAGKLLE